MPNEGWRIPDVTGCKGALERAANALKWAKTWAPESPLFVKRIEEAQDVLNIVLDDLDHIDEW